MSDEANDGTSTPWCQVFLGGQGALLLVGAMVGALIGLPVPVAICALVVGGGLSTLASFWERVEGNVGFTKEGFNATIAAAETRLQRGGTKMIAAGKVGAATEAMRAAVSEFGTPTGEVGTPTTSKSALPQGSSPNGRNIQIIQDAVVDLSTLPVDERAKTQAEIVRMSGPDFDEESDPRAIKTRDQGRSYRVHKVPGTDVRLWYRPLDGDDPDALVIMAVEKRG
ncbi:hypothetical protein [Mycobacteroides abscessus]|uniref:hypothetical protein n=1 Tax=Mycobacteroides abscessus TaxID=36809 RepID=UPI00092C637E|nr:hypothetical protein [Mycobacteroides abscessus]SHR38452.1 Uncharacterised protein [Mycobacteroides abscessus subsp. abscessus]SHR89215.1 Uncharacterised protein [Mycobacteroides abscessus subsp. abscessus]SHS03252.1 Uncharacterised protein [Mycobacteroides abscessus subsp. abscessus]SHS32897.1 Uncharacterised protein [Mycobacteroides abscessus subsp. abscessus]SHS53837.1 Uncharacterised protein [Mycobacteroides abscessus subsp. abscessus]